MMHAFGSRLRSFCCLSLVSLWALASLPAAALTLNGNDFALYFSEAKNDPERKTLLNEAEGNPHFFRYLQIMEMREVEEGGRRRIDLITFEPASLMDVRFSITRSISQKKLLEAPVSKRGDALAVTGKVLQADAKSNSILLGSVIVRHKDRLSPAIGKELLCDVDPGATFYTFTGGDRSVSLTYKDRDLLAQKSQKMKALGRKGWAEYLEAEVAKRDRMRAAKKAAEGTAP